MQDIQSERNDEDTFLRKMKHVMRTVARMQTLPIETETMTITFTVDFGT